MNSMSTLQRSTYSFRRQGSSGRIWENNKLQLPEKKVDSVLQASGTDHESNQEKRISSNQVAEPNRLDGNQPTSSPAKMDSSIAPASSRSGNKGQRRGFVSIFGRCLGSPTPS